MTEQRMKLPKNGIPKAKKLPITSGKDFLGVTIVLGDLVAYSQGQSSGLSLGKISGFTPKGVRLDPIRVSSGGRSVDGYRYYTPNGGSITNRHFQQIVKLPSETQEVAAYPIDWIRGMFESPTETK